MKLIYVASPYAGDVETNIEFAKKACHHVMSEEHVFFAPHLLYPQILNDNNPQERQLGLDMGLAMLEHCDELWVYGGRISHGMKLEIAEAERLGIPTSYVAMNQILDSPNPTYAIWVDTRTDSSFNGQSGFLSENQKTAYFHSQEEAELRISDIRSLCMNQTPVAEYTSMVYLPIHASKTRIQLEMLRKLDLKPTFDAQRAVVRDTGYGNTGGGCMVSTMQFYLPDLDKSVWVNTSDEGVAITSADYVWNEDKSESWERYEDVAILSAEFRDSAPQEVAAWMPLINFALEYTIEQDTAYFNAPFSLPVAWLPESIRTNADPQYLDWLKTEGKEVEIAQQGRIVIDEEYPSRAHTQSGIGEMGYQ